MTENEEIISHLLEMESIASTIVQDAHLEANKRVLEAKTKAEELFNTKYLLLTKEFENLYIQHKQTLTNQHTNQIEQFKKNLNKTKKSLNDFYAFLNKALVR